MLDVGEEILHNKILPWNLTQFRWPSTLATHPNHLGSLIKTLAASQALKAQPGLLGLEEKKSFPRDSTAQASLRILI